MAHENGPDQIIPCENLTTSNIEGSVKIRQKYCNENVDNSILSIPGLLHKTATLYPECIALITKNKDGTYLKYTYKEYEENVRVCAKGFLKLGLKRFEAVGIIGFNSPEWFFADLGAIYAGGIAAGVYATNSSEACHYCAENGNITIFIGENEEQIEKILAIKPRLPNLKTIIQYKGKPKYDDVLSWDKLMQLGREEPDNELNSILKKIAINQCSTLIYTSGTVGNPKAVMLSHDNLVYDAIRIRDTYKMSMCNEVFVSYLPLSHVAAQIVDIYISISAASTVYFADVNALRGTLVNTLKEALPTMFLGVPRVWEKIQEKMLGVGAQSNMVKKVIGNWAKNQGLNYHMNKINGVKQESWGYTFANSLVFKKIKQAVGLDRCTLFVSAAAPISSDVKKYFLSLDIPITEAFGMSEAGGAHALCTYDIYNLETVGRSIYPFQTKIADPNEKGEGEICMYGRHVFMGYKNDPEKTIEAIDEDGWLHSGDIGRIDENRMLYITGRIKEIIITAGGENVAPVPIEQKVKNELPIVSNAVVIGDKRKYLSVLISIQTIINPDTGIPSDTFSDSVKNWLINLGCNATTLSQFLTDLPQPKVTSAIQEAIDRVNAQAISNAQKIQKFAYLPCDFSIATGELGPTTKLRRNIVHEKFNDIIEKLYA